MIARYRLLKPHRIDRELQPVGHEVEMPDQTGDWLVQQGVFERMTPLIAKNLSQATSKASPAPAPFRGTTHSRFSCCGWTAKK